MPARQRGDEECGWVGRCILAYIFRTCFGTFVMTGSNWVLSKLYIILHNIFFFGSSSCAAFQRGYVAGRANSMRHEYHVSQRLVGVLEEEQEGRQVPLVLLVPLKRQ